MPVRTIDNLFHDLHDLPTLPEVVAKILRTIEDEQSSAQDLSEILEQDHAISVRVLRMANSAFYGFRGRVDSIRRALVVIGFDSIRMMALSTSVFDLLNDKRQIALDPHDFWMHSLGAAKAAQLLSRNRANIAATDGCFTAGLLHDVGKYALGLALRDEYKQIIAYATTIKRPLHEAERERLGFDHSEAAAWLGQHWNFPASLTETISNLYNPVHCVDPNRADTAIVALASELSRAAGFGKAAETTRHPLHEQIMEQLGLDKPLLKELVVELEATKEATVQFFNMMANRPESP